MNAPAAGETVTPAAVVEHIAARLSTPLPATEPWMGQSLAQGTAGTALLHIERAHTGHGIWQHTHQWIAAATSGQISAADTSGLFLGAPALAFILHAAAPGPHRYASARSTLDAHVADLAHRRVDAAMDRISRGELANFAEYDIFYGLTGIGAYLLRSDPGGSALERVLCYLVALTQPIAVDGRQRPGWWVAHDPHRGASPPFADGHGNLGAAHGITGPLMLLSQAQRRGITVEGQPEAINIICAHLDVWRQDGEAGPWWPEHLTVQDLATGIPHQPGPARPSWCYGTPGIARAGQLASLAIGDQSQQTFFEDALDACLSDPAQTGRLTDASLCHGWGGVFQTIWRASRDAATPVLERHLPYLTKRLTQQVLRAEGGPGLLEGDAGAVLALMTANRRAAPKSGWDACLLID
ncbi:lanthionine synthetase C family protein [Nocardiopsis sp. NRRL B-16309]|uniref:lanthionine synthetase C family protein n=1 Tax=Nocardiopsis sp. NRRL B-16309 TaxID=1519494 RepID=UPI0006AEEA14|nr:lanthionine synthetase C family protein [Nocardiopsis sp. NRRL B-16309]KOX23807.1 lanthionine synthetase [Nocardiopsis sp. NRRL B-16309]